LAQVPAKGGHQLNPTCTSKSIDVTSRALLETWTRTSATGPSSAAGVHEAVLYPSWLEGGWKAPPLALQAKVSGPPFGSAADTENATGAPGAA
jgi:hypothetical protein